jgi:hypothetical protein
MSININLVDKKSPEESRLEKIKRLKGLSFGLLFLTAFLAILIFGIDYRFSASYVQKQQADLLNEISSYGDTSGKIFIVNNKLSEISQIIASRKKYGEVTKELLAAENSNVTIEEFLYDDNGMTMTVSSDSLEQIDNFLNYTLELADKKVVSGVMLKSLTIDSGKYVADLSII